VDANDHVVRTRLMVREGKSFLREELMRLGLPFVVGEGNFLMIRLPMSDTLAYRKLMAQGAMVRTMGSFRFPNHIRVTISTIDVMESFVRALKTIL
jgi:histidinol-phosphate aminotransferase